MEGWRNSFLDGVFQDALLKLSGARRIFELYRKRVVLAREQPDGSKFSN
jgi:hypothetical protein